MPEITEEEIESQLEEALPSIEVDATIEKEALDITTSKVYPPLELKPGRSPPAVTGSVDEAEELKDEFVDLYFDNFKWESIPEEIRREYEKPIKLPYSDLSRKLSNIFGVELPNDWEDVADIIGRSPEFAKENRGEYGGPDGAFAMKVREELPSEVRYRRLEDEICELDKKEFGSTLEFFTPIQKLSLMRERAERCGDRLAREQLEVRLFGNPRAEEEVEKKGLIEWWHERGEAEDKLERIGYSESEIRELIRRAIGERSRSERKSETVEEERKELTRESVKEKIRKRMRG